MLTHQTLTETESGNMSSSIPYKNITTAGPTIHEITRNISLKSDPIYSQHQRALLIGEKRARQSLLMRLSISLYVIMKYGAAALRLLQKETLKTF